MVDRSYNAYSLVRQLPILIILFELCFGTLKLSDLFVKTEDYFFKDFQ